jgi:two-component system chemotaxis response regulator CheB
MAHKRTARVLVVDDSAFVRRFLTRMIESEPLLELVGTAINGKVGVEKALELKPDLITLDIEMPEMDGLAALEQIRARSTRPKPRILMCSTLTERGSKESLRALSLGASDIILKDLDAFGTDPDAPKREILGKLLGIAGLGSTNTMNMGRSAGQNQNASAQPSCPSGLSARSVPEQTTPEPFEPGFRPELVMIGSSTGGPPVLESVLGALPADFPCPVVIAQHMPPVFTKSIAHRLDGLSAIKVEHAEGRTTLKPGTAYVIQGGQHGAVQRFASGPITLTVGNTPEGLIYTPSVDVLFSSGAKAVRGKGVGVVLTGMGEDGAKGAAMLKNTGAPVLTQTAGSCVIYGMPRAVDQAGLACGSLDPKAMGAHLASLASGASRTAA